jgi:hypothetical protein
LGLILKGSGRAEPFSSLPNEQLNTSRSLSGKAGRPREVPEDQFSRLARILNEDPNIDAVIYDLEFPWLFKELGRSGVIKYLQKVIKGKEELKKPLLVSQQYEGIIELDVFNQEVAEWFHEKNIPTCSSFEIAARVLHNLCEYQTYLTYVSDILKTNNR